MSTQKQIMTLYKPGDVVKRFNMYDSTIFRIVRVLKSNTSDVYLIETLYSNTFPKEMYKDNDIDVLHADNSQLYPQADTALWRSLHGF